jgi:hypothetical protein
MSLTRSLVLLAGSALLVSCGDDATPADTEDGSTSAGSSGATTAPSGSDTNNPPTATDGPSDSGTTDPDGTTGPIFMECGNGIIEGGERCDGDNFDGTTCELQGFDGGTLSCRDDCDKLITDDCFFFFCGNESIQGDEVCDGPATGEETCQTQGFESGALSCNANCSEYDTSTCGVCGNSVIDGDDLCDTGELAGEDCESQGFEYGTLACNRTCDGYVTTSCGLCGDGSQGGSEACDGADLNGATCAGLGLGGGNLACAAACNFDVVGCDIQGGSLVTVRQNDGMLRAYNLISGMFSDIGPVGFFPSAMGLTWDTSTQTLYLLDGSNTLQLYTVNTVTGLASAVGNHGQLDLGGLAYDSALDTMYTTQGLFSFMGGVYTVNPVTAATSLIGSPPSTFDGLTYDVTRNQIIASDCGFNGTAQMYEINPATGAQTPVGTPGPFFVDVCGLAYEPIDDLYWSIDWSGQLFSYDPNNNYAQTQVLTGLNSHDGLAYVPGLVL